MKILIVTASFPRHEDDIEGNFIYSRVLELIKENDVTVLKPNICLKKSLKVIKDKDYYLRGIGEKKVAVQVVNVIRIPNSYRMIGLKRRIQKGLRINKYDLIHCHFAWNAVEAVEVANDIGIPCVVTYHGSDIHTFPMKHKNFLKQTKAVLNTANVNIFVSGYLKKQADLMAGYNKKSYIIHNGINEDFFIDVKKVDKEGDLFKIVFIGRLNKIKRVKYLPSILKKVLEKGINAELHIIGEGDEKQIIQENAENLGIRDRINFYGKVENKKIPEIIKDMSCLLIISKNEGWPCVILEAQACGLPVVGTNNGGIPEAVGKGGIIVSDEDIVNNVSLALVDLYNNPMDRKEISNNAQQFSWKNIVKKEIEVYKELVK